MDRELRSMLAVATELEVASLATFADAVDVLGELAWQCGERVSRGLLGTVGLTAQPGASERERAAAGLMQEYRACLRELAALGSRLSMGFLNHFDAARARRGKWDCGDASN